VAEARCQADERAARFGALAGTSDPEATLADVDHDIAATRQELAATWARVAHLTAEPAILAQPADRLARERDAWRVDRDARRAAASAAALPRPTPSGRPPETPFHRAPSPRSGPSIGR
jgi:exodeoxyribonuclease V alpha subunit